MPYFRNDKINLLFIHIPKTGGTSLVAYFSKKYKIPLDNKSLYLHMTDDTEISDEFDRSISLQHQTYNTIMRFKEEFGIVFDDMLRIITCVRNPYERIVSDLFWHKMIDLTSQPSEVFEIIKEYLSDGDLDNHNIPQYKFLVDENQNIIENLTILRTENLNGDMRSIGFADFDIHIENNPNKCNYYDFLNNDSICLINSFYARDFELFGYERINPDANNP